MSQKEKIEKLLEEELNHIFNFGKGSLIQEDAWLDKTKEKAKQAFMDRYNNASDDDEFKQHVDNVSRHVGVNIDPNKKGIPTVNKMVLSV